MTADLAAGTHINGVALAVLLFFFIIVTFGGFWAARWRRRTTCTRWMNGDWAAAGSAP